MPQIAGYFPLRYQSGTVFNASWSFTNQSGGALDVSGYTGWALTLYDTPGGVVKYASALFTYVNSGTGNATETANATTQPLAASGIADFGWYELVAIPPGQSVPVPLMHGPYVFDA